MRAELHLSRSWEAALEALRMVLSTIETHGSYGVFPDWPGSR